MNAWTDANECLELSNDHLRLCLTTNSYHSLDLLLIDNSTIDEFRSQSIPSFDFHDRNVCSRQIVYSHVKQIWGLMRCLPTSSKWLNRNLWRTSLKPTSRFQICSSDSVTHEQLRICLKHKLWITSDTLCVKVLSWVPLSIGTLLLSLKV